MRDRKYRAWHDGKMVYWGFLRNDDLWLLDAGISLETTDPIMDYIGIKDKGGTEIYEGDLMKSNPDSGGRIRQVIHDEDTGGYRFNTGADITHSPNWKVIGNIYENPELLEVK